jgi:hypothetical protein
VWLAGSVSDFISSLVTFIVLRWQLGKLRKNAGIT